MAESRLVGGDPVGEEGAEDMEIQRRRSHLCWKRKHPNYEASSRRSVSTSGLKDAHFSKSRWRGCWSSEEKKRSWRARRFQSSVELFPFFPQPSTLSPCVLLSSSQDGDYRRIFTFFHSHLRTPHSSPRRTSSQSPGRLARPPFRPSSFPPSTSPSPARCNLSSIRGTIQV